MSFRMKPGVNKLSEAEIIGDRKNYEVTLFPSTVKAGELLKVRLLQLRKDVCLVPNSVNIAFEFKVTGTKATCVNNLAKALVKVFPRSTETRTSTIIIIIIIILIHFYSAISRSSMALYKVSKNL